MKTFIALFALLACFQTYAQMPTTEEWQEDLKFIQQKVHKDYAFLFKKVTAEEFDKAVGELHDKIPEMHPHEVVVGFAKIIALFKYGHTYLSFRDGPVTFHKLPIRIHQFSDGVYIIGAQSQYADLAGAELLEIEGKGIQDVLKAVYPVEPVENDQYFKAYGINTAMFPEVLHAQGITESLEMELTLTLKKAGKTSTTAVKAVTNSRFPLQYGEVKPDSDWVSARDLSQSPLYLKGLDKIYFSEYLPEEKTVYVRHSQIQDDPSEPIPVFYGRLFDFIENNDVERLILDYRLNGGGNNYKNKPIVTGIIKTDKINQIGKLYVIIGRRTFSACQNLVNELHNYTNVIFVGEPTAENINFYGDNRKVVLPKSKLSAYLSFAWWQDKPQWENGPYIAPDVPVDMSFSEYQSNSDPVLEKALRFDGSNFVKDPVSYLSGLFIDGKIELLQSEAKRLVQDPLYSNVPFEQEFNKAGFRLLDADQVKEAIFVFELNAELFPKSAAAWSALAEAYQKAGDADKAKIHFGKAVEMDPTGPTGKYARKKLAELD